MQFVFATRDSSNELGMATLGAHPTQSIVGGAAIGGFGLKNTLDAASLDAAGNGETLVEGMSIRGGPLDRGVRVSRRSGRSWGLELTTSIGRGRYLGGVPAAHLLVLISLAGAALPLFVAEAGGIVFGNTRRFESGSVPVEQVMSWVVALRRLPFFA